MAQTKSAVSRAHVLRFGCPRSRAPDGVDSLQHPRSAEGLDAQSYRMDPAAVLRRYPYRDNLFYADPMNPVCRESERKETLISLQTTSIAGKRALKPVA